MKHKAIYETHPDVVTISGNRAFDNDGNEIVLNQSLITTKLAELQADYDSKQYQRDRAIAYPSWQDQLDKIFHDGIDAWKANIQAIKDQFPKP